MPIRRTDRKGQSSWFGRISLPSGKSVEKRCESKRGAQEWEILARSRVERFEKTDTVSLAYLAERYLDNVQTRLSRNSYNDKCCVFRGLLQFVPPTTLVSKVSYARMEAFLDQISKEKSGHRANKYRVHLVRAYNWGIKALGLPTPNPWTVERYKEDKHPRYVPPVADFWLVFDCAEEEEKRILLTFLNTAGRMQEIFRLKWEDVDLENGRLRLWTNKRRGGREFDWLPMTTDLSQTLKAQRVLTGFCEYVFTNLATGTRYISRDHMMRRLCTKAGVKGFGFHAIRHLSASILDNAGVPLAAIQEILRHRSSRTTARYIHSLSGTKIALNEAFRRDRGQNGGDETDKARGVSASQASAGKVSQLVSHFE